MEVKKELKDKKQRPVMTCLVCNKYEYEVRKLASNGRIPVAGGIRVDGKNRLKLIVDHLLSPAHEEELRLKQHDEMWSSNSDSHPWVKLMKKCTTETLEFLVRMAVDAYNDCQVETLSWPSRSLESEHSNNLVRIFRSEGWDTEFVPFNTLGSLYHYRDPVTFAEMRDIIAQLEIKKIAVRKNSGRGNNRWGKCKYRKECWTVGASQGPYW